MFNKIPEVKYQDLKEEDIIIDVREPFEFENDHVENAINIPLQEIINYRTTETIFLMCESGNRSAQATKYLREQGVSAINIKGGMQSVR